MLKQCWKSSSLPGISQEKPGVRYRSCKKECDFWRTQTYFSKRQSQVTSAGGLSEYAGEWGVLGMQDSFE